MRCAKSFDSGRSSEEETSATIQTLFATTGEVLCPHSAVGVKVAEGSLGQLCDDNAGNGTSRKIPGRRGRSRRASACFATLAGGFV